ncbi:hypothetical protein F2Q70_00037457 [Brassica cretica]|uniref:Activator of Hsp90 ATPase homologue 1/2-like C-terminal domain-containing protein n=1 Tax=Brassica cretica TaxID=69181 RepID=A0A8S9JRM0_BRACR|nr:hypothetical protein F2Q70_00037457 [Brassica cretica]
MVTKGKMVVHEKVRVYVEAMAKGGPCRDELESKKVAPKGKEKPSGLPVVSDAKESKVVKEKKGNTKEGNAKISRYVTGEISVFDGSVTGMNVELEEGKLIVQKWRFGSWPDGLDSTVRITFEEPEPGVTIVNLTHTDIPEEDRYGNATVVENTERGWRDLIFHRIRAVFGFGI